jgi:hypothetical protein
MVLDFSETHPPQNQACKALLLSASESLYEGSLLKMISSLFIIVSHLCTMHKDEQRTDYYKVIFRFHCNTKHLIVKIVLHISQRSVLSEFLI